MPTNDFLAVADAVGANVLTQAEYAALTAYLDNGFSSGIVPSDQFNKTLRQSSTIAYLIGQFIADQSGLDALDDGNISVLLARFLTAVRKTASAQTDFLTDTGAANAYVVATTPVTALYHNGQVLAFRAANSNTTASTINAGAGAVPLTRRNGTALQAADIAAGQIYLVGYVTSITGFAVIGVVSSDYLDSPTFRGTPRVPTAAPLTPGTVASSTAYADAAVAAATFNVSAQVVTAGFTAGPTGDYWTNTTAGGFTIVLPDPPSGANPLNFHDVAGTWETNPLIINPQSKSIQNPYELTTGNMICDVSGESFRLWYDGTNWRME